VKRLKMPGDFSFDFSADFSISASTQIYEPIMNELADLLTTALVPGTFRYVSRRFVTWENLIQNIQSGISPFIQPALLIYDGVGFGGGHTKYEQRGRGRPPVRVLSRTLVVYAQLPGGGTPSGPDAITPGGTIFAPLVEAIEGVFAAVDSEGALTLGGLVSHCWIDGDSHWLTPDIDPQGQGMMTIPVQIMIP
jgi:hypothetical protein